MWILAVQNSHELIYTRSLYLLFELLEKCMTFKDIFSGLSRSLRFNFQDFPGPNWFSETFQVLEFSRKNPGLSRMRCNQYTNNNKRNGKLCNLVGDNVKLWCDGQRWWKTINVINIVSIRTRITHFINYSHSWPIVKHLSIAWGEK